MLAFVQEHAPGGEPVVVAGDFNLDVNFSDFDDEPAPRVSAVSAPISGWGGRRRRQAREWAAREVGEWGAG